MFNDKFLLTQDVLRGEKTQTRRIVKDGTPFGNFEEMMKYAPYKAGEVVAVAQSYKAIYDENGKLELSRYGGIPNRGGRMLTLEERLTVTRLLSIRYWNEKEKARKNGTFITTQD